MHLVILESPYAGNTEANLTYARRAIRDCLSRGESPYASHLIIPSALDDNVPAERDKGIRAGYAWWKCAQKVVFYCDLGMSPGMQKAMHRVKTMKMPFEERYLDKDIKLRTVTTEESRILRRAILNSSEVIDEGTTTCE